MGQGTMIELYKIIVREKYLKRQREADRDYIPLHALQSL